jgi:hypothetical protein
MRDNAKAAATAARESLDVVMLDPPCRLEKKLNRKHAPDHFRLPKPDSVE